MSQTLYTQLVHLAAFAAVSVLVGIGKLDVTTGIALLAGLVGIALPSPYTAGVPASSSAPTPSTKTSVGSSAPSSASPAS